MQSLESTSGENDGGQKDQRTPLLSHFILWWDVNFPGGTTAVKEDIGQKESTEAQECAKLGQVPGLKEP